MLARFRRRRRRPKFGAACALMVAAACGPDEATVSDAGKCSPVDGLFVASDASSSAFGGFSFGAAATLTTGIDLGKDPAFAVSAGRAFFVARDLDTLFEIDPTCGVPISKVSIAEAGRTGSTNPQDVGVAMDGSLWVPRYQEPNVLVLSPEGARKTVDLSAHDVDGNPNLAAIHVTHAGGPEKAYVTLQRIDEKDGYVSRRPSAMVRIDVARGEVDGEVELAGRNPFTLMVPFDGGLWFGSIGSIAIADEPDAGIERFDPATMTSRLVVSEAALGGSVIALALGEACGAAIVADARKDVNATSVVTFDPKTGAVSKSARDAVLGPTPGYDLWSVAWSGDTLIVADRRRADAGYPLHTFTRSAGCTLEAKPDVIFVGQKPVAVRSLPLPP